MAKIEEDYVSFETAKLLKEKGFKEECEYFYDEYEDEDEYVICSNGGTYNNDEHPTYYSMPTLQMAMKWLREVHNWNVVIRKSHTIYGYDIYIESLVASNVVECAFEKTYEEACEAANKYCLENLI